MNKLTMKFTRDDIAHLLWVEATRRIDEPRIPDPIGKPRRVC